MERFFIVLQTITIAVFFIIGAILYRIGTSDLLLDSKSQNVVQTSFVMEEQKLQTKKEELKKPVEKKKINDDIQIDLTKKTEEPVEEPKPVRRIYGLKKVYSQGLGVGGESQDAIVGKVGNTLDKDYDTLTASADDLKKRAAPQKASSATTVTKRPALKADFRKLKPQYSKDMLQNKAEGTVKARLLIDTNGTVKKVEILEDIGYDSADVARAFLQTLEFDPAMKDGEPVSVWIPFSIKFELI